MLRTFLLLAVAASVPLAAADEKSVPPDAKLHIEKAEAALAEARANHEKARQMAENARRELLKLRVREDKSDATAPIDEVLKTLMESGVTLDEETLKKLTDQLSGVETSGADATIRIHKAVLLDRSNGGQGTSKGAPLEFNFRKVVTPGNEAGSADGKVTKSVVTKFFKLGEDGKFRDAEGNEMATPQFQFGLKESDPKRRWMLGSKFEPNSKPESDGVLKALEKLDARLSGIEDRLKALEAK